MRKPIEMYPLDLQTLMHNQKESVPDCAKKLEVTINSFRKMVERGTVKPSVYRKLIKVYGADTIYSHTKQEVFNEDN